MLWKGFQRPKRLDFERETLTDRFGRFYAQPFERGFGTTIGNALRRVLLSSIEGAAITAVKIDGVLHEFSPIKGVVEDATDIILNLKQLPLKLPRRLHQDAVPARRQAGRRSARRDIEADADVEILEPDAHIATVSEGGKLHMELRVKRGRGYVAADSNFDEDLGIGWIPIDSVHSPVNKVNYLVEAARIGQATYSRPQIASIGRTQARMRAGRPRVKIGKFPFQAVGKALIGGEYEGFVKVIADKKTDEVLGVHMIGPHVTDLIAEASRGHAARGDRVGDRRRGPPAPDAVRGARRSGPGRRRQVDQLLGYAHDGDEDARRTQTEPAVRRPGADLGPDRATTCSRCTG